MERFKALPNAFYDLIVFVIPTLLLALGGTIGFRGIEIFSLIDLSKLKTLSSILALMVALVVSYEYGRIAETWSAILVQNPLKFIAKHTPFLSSPDFLSGHPHALNILKLSPTYDGRTADKWVIYFYAFVASPVLGSDLLKRYAWEKLSRSAAFSYGILTISSILTAVYNYFLPQSIFVSGTGCFGSWIFSSLVLILSILTYYEYYKRNVWNFDLLTKITPVLITAYKLVETSKNDIVLVHSQKE